MFFSYQLIEFSFAFAVATMAFARKDYLINKGGLEDLDEDEVEARKQFLGCMILYVCSQGSGAVGTVGLGSTWCNDIQAVCCLTGCISSGSRGTRACCALDPLVKNLSSQTGVSLCDPTSIATQSWLQRFDTATLAASSTPKLLFGRRKDPLW